MDLRDYKRTVWLVHRRIIRLDIQTLQIRGYKMIARGLHYIMTL
jgi:hypothetical protein